MSGTLEWLQWLFGAQTDGLIWVGGHGDGFRGRVFTSLEHAAAYARRLDAEGAARGDASGVYFRLTPMRTVGQGRGTAADSTALVAFGADLDLAGPGHKDAKLPRPETSAQLLAILRDAGVPEPSAWVHSGGGRYAFWKLTEPLALAGQEQLAEAQRVSATLHERIIAAAARLGWKIDNTRDLARIYRLPGTHNRKTEPAVRAEVIHTDGPLHTFAAMHDALLPEPEPEPVAERSAQGAGASSLFGGGQGDGGVRHSVSYTLADAMAFVAPALDRLRSAADGEINNRLNDAAMALAHFGEQFWSREAAEKQLYAALEKTVYDGATWQAADTIDSAYKAMAARGQAGDAECWSAELLPEWTAQPGGVVAGDEVDALLAEMLTPDQVAERPPPRYLVHKYLQFDSETWMIGPPGSKKSFVALDMAAHVARGEPWQGFKVRQATVVFIVAEGAGGLMPRVRAWELQNNKKMNEFGNFHILPRPVQAKDKHAWQVLVQACRRLGAGFVIVDTQARVTVGMEENSATDMGEYVEAVRAIREATGACVKSVHHTGRKGGDARGSSAIDGAQTTELKVVADPDGEHVTLYTEKQKDIEPAEPLKLKFTRLTVGQDDDGEPITSLVLLGQDEWRRDEVQHGAPGEGNDDAHTLPEPEDWTKRIFDNPKHVLARRILQAMALSRGVGRTEAAIRKVVVERWYPGGEGRGRGKLVVDKREQGWMLAWTSCREAAWEGEPVLYNPVPSQSMSFAINPLVTSLAYTQNLATDE